MPLTDEQKKTIIRLRNNKKGYRTIASELNVTRDQVRDFLKTKTALQMGLKTDIKVEKPKRKQRTCVYCSSSYDYLQSTSQLYCSEKCKKEMSEKRKQERIKKKLKACIKCGKTFLPRSNLQKYCSTECRMITKTCKCCGNEFTVINKQSTRNQRFCSHECEGQYKRKSHEEYYKEFSKIHKGQIVPIEKYKTADELITVFCIECNKKTKRRAYEFVQEHNPKGCMYCSNNNGYSLAEEYIEDWLIQHQINYVREYSFHNLVDKDRLRFDFAIFDSTEKLILLIEYDGRQHFEPVESFGGVKEFNQQKKRDAMKNKFVKENNLKLLRINYLQKDYLDEILNQNLIYSPAHP